jgi:hypothetical protein
MNLYVVVHHQQDPDQKWVNSWLDDDRLESITTPAEIGEYCLNAMKKGERVFVHRCGWGDASPIVCCSVKVIQSADLYDNKTWLVKFGDPQILGTETPQAAYPGLNFYWA